MKLLYGLTSTGEPKLIATFDSEQQLRDYVTWATRKSHDDGTQDFDGGSALADFKQYTASTIALTDDDIESVWHNPPTKKGSRMAS